MSTDTILSDERIEELVVSYAGGHLTAAAAAELEAALSEPDTRTRIADAFLRYTAFASATHTLAPAHMPSVVRHRRRIPAAAAGLLSAAALLLAVILPGTGTGSTMVATNDAIPGEGQRHIRLDVDRPVSSEAGAMRLRFDNRDSHLRATPTGRVVRVHVR